MTQNAVTSANLGKKMFDSARDTLGNKYDLVKTFLEGESEKLAITLRMIIEASAKGEITDEEAKVLLNQQKIAVVAVLSSGEGMAAITIQSAINAALNEVRHFVNGKVGFPLL